MDIKKLMHMLDKQEWIVENAGDDGTGATIEMGQNQGILILQLTPNGKVSFPTRMGFLPPEYCNWQFNEAQQLVELMDKDYQITTSFSLPQNEGLHLIMREHNPQGISRRLITRPKLFKEIRKPIIPAPQLAAGKMILTKNYQPNSKIGKIAKNNVLGVHRIQNDLKHLAGVNEILNYLIEHSALKEIAVISDENLQDNPFVKLDRSKIRVNSSLTILVASRALLIELLGQVLIEAYHQAFENQIMQDEDVPVSIKNTLETKFKDRVQWI